MAQITISDVSQKPATHTLAFAVAGEEFVLDVTAAENKMFFKVVQQFIDAGRAKNGTTPPAAPAAPAKGRARKATAKKSTMRKTAAKKSAGRPASAKKTAAKKSTAKKSTAKKSAATTATTAAGVAPAKKAAAKRGPGRPSGVKLPDGTRVPRGEVEAWASSQGKTFAKRGPLSPSLLAEYAAANTGGTDNS